MKAFCRRPRVWLAVAMSVSSWVASAQPTEKAYDDAVVKHQEAFKAAEEDIARLILTWNQALRVRQAAEAFSTITSAVERCADVRSLERLKDEDALQCLRASLDATQLEAGLSAAAFEPPQLHENADRWLRQVARQRTGLVPVVTLKVKLILAGAECSRVLSNDASQPTKRCRDFLTASVESMGAARAAVEALDEQARQKVALEFDHLARLTVKAERLLEAIEAAHAARHATCSNMKTAFRSALQPLPQNASLESLSAIPFLVRERLSRVEEISRYLASCNDDLGGSERILLMLKEAQDMVLFVDNLDWSALTRLLCAPRHPPTRLSALARIDPEVRMRCERQREAVSIPSSDANYWNSMELVLNRRCPLHDVGGQIFSSLQDKINSAEFPQDPINGLAFLHSDTGLRIWKSGAPVVRSYFSGFQKVGDRWYSYEQSQPLFGDIRYYEYPKVLAKLPTECQTLMRQRQIGPSIEQKMAFLELGLVQ